MGFTIMESFMDAVKVRSTPGKGTTVTMRKALRPSGWGEGVIPTETATPPPGRPGRGPRGPAAVWWRRTRGSSGAW